MRDVKIVKINLQESMLVIDEHNRIDSVIAIYSKHTNTVTVRDSFWNSNKEIEAHFKFELGIDNAPNITSCLGFEIKATE